MIGQTVSDHRILDKLGFGGAGNGYCARDTKARRDKRNRGIATVI